MAAKPEWFRVFRQRFLNVRPNFVDFGFKTSMDFTDGLRQCSQCIGVGTDIILVIDIRTPENDDTVMFVLKPIGLRTTAIEELSVGKP